MQNRIYCFDPIYNTNSSTLILGTIPGVESLKANTYYANKSNHFWDFMYRILDPGYPPYTPFDFAVPKSDRYALLLKNNLALWDIISSCIRNGSNDKDIIDEKINDVLSLLSLAPFKRILCNGKKAFKLLKENEQYGKITVPVIPLNSTSSLNPNNTFFIFQEWRLCLLTETS